MRLHSTDSVARLQLQKNSGKRFQAKRESVLLSAAVIAPGRGHLTGWGLYHATPIRGYTVKLKLTHTFPV